MAASRLRARRCRTRPSVSEICRRLDGIPLAIELAAARVSSMRPADIAARLGERFRLLTGGRRTAVERHQTLRATVDWSYSLLEENERDVFDRLGVFAGELRRQAAETVAGGRRPRGLGRGRRDRRPRREVDARRRRHQTTARRATACSRPCVSTRVERLADRGDVDAWRRRHAEHYARTAETIGTNLVGPDELGWRQMLLLELDNFRSAVTWSLDRDDPEDVELAVRIIAALTSEAYANPSVSVGSWAEQAIGHLDATTPGRRATVLGAAATERHGPGRLHTARRLGRGGDQRGNTSDWRPVSFPFVALAYSQLVGGQYDDAVATATEGERMVRAVGADPWDLVHMLNTVSAFGAMNPTTNGCCRPPAKPSVSGASSATCSCWSVPSTDSAGHWSAPMSTGRGRQPRRASRSRRRRRARRTRSNAAFAAHLRARTGDEVGAIEALQDAFLYLAEVGDRPAVPRGSDVRDPDPGPVGRTRGRGDAPRASRSTASSPRTEQLPEHATGGLRPADRHDPSGAGRRGTGPRCRRRGAAMTYEEAVDYTIVELDRIALRAPWLSLAAEPDVRS